MDLFAKRLISGHDIRLRPGSLVSFSAEPVQGTMSSLVNYNFLQIVLVMDHRSGSSSKHTGLSKSALIHGF